MAKNKTVTRKQETPIRTYAGPFLKVVYEPVRIAIPI
jgi:hypothetical protein